MHRALHRRGGHRVDASRALRRNGLSARSRRGRDPAAGPDRRGGGRVRRDHDRPPTPRRPLGRHRRRGAARRTGAPVRPGRPRRAARRARQRHTDPGAVPRRPVPRRPPTSTSRSRSPHARSARPARSCGAGRTRGGSRPSARAVDTAASGSRTCGNSPSICSALPRLRPIAPPDRPLPGVAATLATLGPQIAGAAACVDLHRGAARLAHVRARRALRCTDGWTRCAKAASAATSTPRSRSPRRCCARPGRTARPCSNGTRSSSASARS